MTKIIGIGRCGNNILEFLKKQNYQVKRDLNYQFISLNNDESFNSVNFNKDDIVITIAGFGGSKGSKYTQAISKKAIVENIKVKSFVILPFLFEGKANIVNSELEQLFQINQNVEMFANDELLTDANKDKKIPEVMREYDSVIFGKITNKNQFIWRNFIITKKAKNKTYKAVVKFWSKSYKITLIEPKYKAIGISHMLYMAPSRFAFKDEDRSVSSIQDIEEIARRVLNSYIENQS